MKEKERELGSTDSDRWTGGEGGTLKAAGACGARDRGVSPAKTLKEHGSPSFEAARTLGHHLSPSACQR